MFIAIVSYKKPLDDVDRHLAAHRAFLDRHYESGEIIASGPQTPRQGGVIMLGVESRERALGILAEDPFNVNGIADYQVVEFTPTKFCDDALRPFLTCRSDKK